MLSLSKARETWAVHLVRLGPWSPSVPLCGCLLTARPAPWHVREDCGVQGGPHRSSGTRQLSLGDTVTACSESWGPRLVLRCHHGAVGTLGASLPACNLGLPPDGMQLLSPVAVRGLGGPGRGRSSGEGS